MCLCLLLARKFASSLLHRAATNEHRALILRGCWRCRNCVLDSLILYVHPFQIVKPLNRVELLPLDVTLVFKSLSRVCISS